jgi:hypothetical protein
MTASTTDRVSVRRRIAASAVAIFLVLTHAQGHARIDGSGTLVAARGVDLIEAVGSVFEVDVQDLESGERRMANTVTRLEPDLAIEWLPAVLGEEPLGYAYGYLLRQIDEHTTEVTAYYDWSAVALAQRDRLRPPDGIATYLAQTLENLDRLVTGWRL